MVKRRKRGEKGAKIGYFCFEREIESIRDSLGKTSIEKKVSFLKLFSINQPSPFLQPYEFPHLPPVYGGRVPPLYEPKHPGKTISTSYGRAHALSCAAARVTGVLLQIRLFYKHILWIFIKNMHNMKKN
jgi:hypothetical protein